MHTKMKLRGLAAAAAISLGVGAGPVAEAEELELLDPGVLHLPCASCIAKGA